MHEESPRSPASRIAFSFPAECESIGEMRHLVITEAKTLPFSEEDIDDISLAVSETFTNLVQYSPGHRIRGVCEVSPHQLEIRFEVDQDIANYLQRRQLPTGMSSRGRGIPLMHLLMPTIELNNRGDGMVELRMIKPVMSVEGGLQ